MSSTQPVEEQGSPQSALLPNRDALNLADARLQVELIYGPADHPVSLRLLKRGAAAMTLEGSIDGLWPQITDAQAEGFQVYIRPNEGGWKDAEITRAHIACADFDHAELPATWHVPPAFIVQRNPERSQAWWITDDLTPAQFRTLQLQIAQHYGTDEMVATPATLLRLAGTFNLKGDTPKPEIYRLVDMTGDLETVDRPLAEISAGLPAVITREKGTAARGEVRRGCPVDAKRTVGRAIRYLTETAKPAIEGSGGQGGSGQTIRVANVVMDYGVSEELCIALMAKHFNPRCNPPWDDDDLEGLIDRAVACRQNPIGEWYVGPELFKDHLPLPAEVETEVDGGVRVPKFKLHTLAEVMRRPPPVWLFPDIWPEEELIMAFGKPGAGKTWWVGDLALHLATGMAGYGRPAGPPVDVVYFCLEGAKQFVQKRVAGWCGHYGYDILDSAAVRLMIAEVSPDWNDDDDLAELGKDIKAAGLDPKAIIIDTLARAVSTSSLKEDTEGFGRMIVQAEKVKRDFHCAVVLIHHTPVDNDERSRGAGALNAGIGAEHRVRGNTTKETLNAGTAWLTVQCTKMQSDEMDDVLRCFRVDRASPGVILVPIPYDEYKELRARATKGEADTTTLRRDVLAALVECCKGGATEVYGPHLSSIHVEIEEAARVAAGGYTHRTPDQMKADASKWSKHTLNPAVAKLGPDNKSVLDDVVVYAPNGEPKRGPRNELIFRLPADYAPPPRSSVGLGQENED